MQSPKMEGLDKREAALSDSESPIKHDDSLTANHGHNGSRLPTNVPVADHAVFISNNANNHYYTDDPLSDDDALSDVKVFPGSFSTAEIKGLPGSFSTIAVADAFAQRMTGNGSGSYAFKFRNQDEFFQAFPPGYRFKPSDEDLVVHYLHKKISNQRLPPNRIKDVELYKHNPDALAALHQSCGEKEWYFLTPRDRKYRNGVRPNRKAGDGYWKATGADKVVNYKGNKVGFRKALVFYTGKPPKGTKTDWIMHEFRVDNPPKRPKTANNDMRLDDWVLCRIYRKVDKSSKPPNRQRDNAVPDQPSGQQVSELNYVDNPLVAMPEINGIYSDLGFLGTYDNFIYPDYETGLLGDPRNELFRLPECFPLDQATPYVGKLVFDHSSAVMANSPLSKLSPQTTLQSRQLNEFNEDEVFSDQRQENLDFLSSDSDVHLGQ